MNITITIENPSANVLNALAQAIFNDVTTTVPDAPIITPQPDPQDTGLTPAQVEAAQYDPQDTALRIASVADIDNYLDVGSEVHWHGQKYVFDGVVEKIEGEEEWTDTTKILFIRRNDTDKLVSLTVRDLQTGRLTLVD